MDKQVSHLISVLDAIAFSRQQDPTVLKQMARDALAGFMSAQQSVQRTGATWLCHYCNSENSHDDNICAHCGKSPRR